MQTAHTHTATRPLTRIAYGVASVLLLATAIELCRRHGGWWQLGVFGLGPDLALLAGIDTSLEKGRLHPRAVPLYNALHSYWGPCLLAIGAIALSGGYLVGALVWAFHISLDRTVGYGKRTPAGFQRGA